MTIDEIPEGYRIISQGDKRFQLQRRFLYFFWATHKDRRMGVSWSKIYHTKQEALNSLEKELIRRLPWKVVIE